MAWSIFYGNGLRVDGVTREDWIRAPRKGVQVIRVPEPYPERNGHPVRPWIGVDDRQLWTGTDSYDPFGWGEKLGSLIPDEDYETIWNEAAYGIL